MDFISYLSNKSDTFNYDVKSVLIKDESLDDKYSFVICSDVCDIDGDCISFSEIKSSVLNIPYHNGIDLYSDLIISCDSDEIALIKLCQGYTKGFSIKLYGNIIMISLYNSYKKYDNQLRVKVDTMLSGYKQYLLNTLENLTYDYYRQYIVKKYNNTFGNCEM